MTATTAPATREKRGIPGLAQLQRVGRSLMLPIASLPAAALLLREAEYPALLAGGGCGGGSHDRCTPHRVLCRVRGRVLRSCASSFAQSGASSCAVVSR